MTRWPAAASWIAFLLAAGCAAIRGDVPPDWVAGKSAQYPDARYLLGRGQALDQEDARNRARADLAKILETSVKVETSDVTRYASSALEGDKARLESEVSRQIVTRTEKIIQGIQIAELWQDPRTRMHHALAILPRQHPSVRMIRTREWKYIHRYPFGAHELYNLTQDPGENNNRIDDTTCKSVARELRHRLSRWFERHVDSLRDGSRLPVSGSGQLFRIDGQRAGEECFSSDRIVLEKSGSPRVNDKLDLEAFQEGASIKA